MKEEIFTLIGYELPNSRLGKHGTDLDKQFAGFLKKNPLQWGPWPKPISNNQAEYKTKKITEGRDSNFPKGIFEASVREGVLYVRCSMRDI